MASLGLFSKLLKKQGWFSDKLDKQGIFDRIIIETDSATTTYTISANTGANFGGVVDSYIVTLTPNTNYGTNTDVIVGSWDTNDVEKGVIKFGGLTSVPSGTVVNARLRLYFFENNQTVVVQAYALAKAFVENQVTWNDASTGVGWTTAGASNTPSDYVNTLLGSFTVSTTGLYIEISGAALISYVQNVINGGTDYGLLLVEQNWQTPAGLFNFSKFRSSNGTDGQRPELVVELTAGGGGPTIIDLTLATLNQDAQGIQNRAAVVATTPLLKRIAQAIQNRASVTTTLQTINQDPQAVQNRLSVVVTSRVLNQDAQSVQNRLNVSATTSTLNQDPQPTQNRLLVTATSPLLRFVAHAVDVVNIAGAVVIDLTVASLKLVAQSIQNRVGVITTTPLLKRTAQAVQNRLSVALTLQTLNQDPQAVQNRVTMTTTLASLKRVAQSVQNRLTVTLTSTQARLVTLAQSARYSITTTTRTITLTAQSVQTRLVVSLTRANLFFNAQFVEPIGGMFVVVAAKVGYAITKFRKLLRQRKY